MKNFIGYVVVKEAKLIKDGYNNVIVFPSKEIAGQYAGGTGKILSLVKYHK